MPDYRDMPEVADVLNKLDSSLSEFLIMLNDLKTAKISRKEVNLTSQDPATTELTGNTLGVLAKAEEFSFNLMNVSNTLRQVYAKSHIVVPR